MPVGSPRIPKVDRRTGGLEIYGKHVKYDGIVDRRTGGLEILFRVLQE